MQASWSPEIFLAFSHPLAASGLAETLAVITGI
jgi:hypothetical protein